MPDNDAANITQLIDDAISRRQLVTAQALSEAIATIKRDAASDVDLQRTNAVVQMEQAARHDLERRLSRLETDVQDIATKMGTMLEGMTALRKDQADHFDDVRLLRNEVQALSTASETLLELSKQRASTTNHVMSIQAKHSELLNNLTDEGSERAEELVRLDASMTSLQAVVVANQARLEDIAERIDKVDGVLSGMGAVVTMVTSRRARSIGLGILALLMSAALNIDLITIIETVARIVGGP
jgi:predicted  nucleic acid-binding Zn-ribbon protein